MDTSIDVDNIWKTLGVWRKYQLLQLSILYLSTVPVSYPVLIWVFIGSTPSFQCSKLTKRLEDYNIGYYGNASDYSIEYGKCDLKIGPKNISDDKGVSTNTFKCLEGYVFDTTEGMTVPMQWNLVCDRAGLGEMSTTMVVVGMMFGAFLFTSLADRFGRKPVHITLHVLLFVANVGLAFIPVFPVFALVRLIIGALQQGVGLSGAILVVELFPLEWRGLLGGIGGFWWSFCVCSLTVFGYFMRNLPWHYIQIASAMTSIPSLMAYCFLDESLRWLVANGKKDESIRVVKKTSKLNRSDPEPILSAIQESELSNLRQRSCTEPYAYMPISNTNEASPHNVVRYTFVDILKNKILLRNSFILWYTWLVNSMTYYGLFLTTNELPVDRHVNYFINGVMEIPAVFFYLLIINRLGRKITSIIFHGVAGFSLIISVSLLSIQGNQTATTLSIIFNYIGKMGISASFGTVFMYTPELYPTNLRNAGIGIASSFARIGAMVSPYSGILASYAIWIPGVLFGTCCVLVMFLMFLLPETCGHTLPQTIEELVKWTREQSKLGLKTANKYETTGNTDDEETSQVLQKEELERAWRSGSP